MGGVNINGGAAAAFSISRGRGYLVVEEVMLGIHNYLRYSNNIIIINNNNNNNQREHTLSSAQ
jgi:hypothetical protein